MATGTVSPNPFFQFFDDSGNPLSGGLLDTFSAGTTTRLATYSDVALTTPNANPVVLDSAGRCTLFLSATSYKFVLKNSAGVTIATRDNVGSVPANTVDTDVTGTAGSALTATKAAYLNASTWLLADADAASSSTLPPIGFVVADIANGASGTFRTAGRMTGFSGLTPGSDYYLSATAGEITTTAPTNARYVGRADSISTLIITPNPRPASYPEPPNGRLTLTSNTPVTASDVTAATTLYFTPYGGNGVSLYDGSAWVRHAFAQLSIAVPATTNQMYDVFVYDNAGALTLELTAWTNDTTRATALVLQNGVNVKTGALTRLYLGSFRTTAVSGQTEDSRTKRLLWNYYRRVLRPMVRLETTANWTYTLTTIQQANASAANRLDIVVGVAEVSMGVSLTAAAANTMAGVSFTSGIGYDVTNGYTGTFTGVSAPSANNVSTLASQLVHMPAIGFHFYSWNEGSQASGVTTFSGAAGGGAGVQTGLEALWES